MDTNAIAKIAKAALAKDRGTPVNQAVVKKWDLARKKITSGLDPPVLGALDKSPAQRNKDDMMLIDNYAFRSNVTLIEHMPAHKREMLWSMTPYVFFDSGHWLWKEGDKGDCMYILLKGTMGVMRHVKGQGKPKEIGQMQTGNTFGEIAFLEPEKKRAAGIVTLEPCHCLYIGAACFTKCIKLDPRAHGIEPDLLEALVKRPHTRGPGDLLAIDNAALLLEVTCVVDLPSLKRDHLWKNAEYFFFDRDDWLWKEVTSFHPSLSKAQLT
mmetsp:Transcript_46047/g.147245  ORF Transcript_46047/g.147245 Transcript_46047/m.147245 type:complete len:268 (+) Transcript_46047:296-1099(+)